MKRFRELVADVRRRYSEDDFFKHFENLCRTNSIMRKEYRSYNDALMLLDDESWCILKAKALEHFKVEREGQQKQSFFNQLNECFAYRYLRQQGFQNVRFIKEGKKKSPDLSFMDERTKRYCEVKTVGISDNEINRRSNHKAYDGRVYCDLSAGFQNKLKADVERAWEQIHSFGESGLVFLLVRFDDIALDHYRNYRKQLKEFCRRHRFENLMIKINHRGHRRIRI